MRNSFVAKTVTQNQMMSMHRGYCHRRHSSSTSSSSCSRADAAMAQAAAAACKSEIGVSLHQMRAQHITSSIRQQSAPKSATTIAARKTSQALLQSSSNSSSGSCSSSRFRTSASADCTSAAVAASDLNPLVYTDLSVHPEPFVGPITAALIPGKGRGLIATEPLHPGQLLLVTPPLALIEGDLGEIPEHDELVDCIHEGGLLLSPWQTQWLNTLVCTVDSGDNTDSSRQDSSSSSSSAVEVPDMLPPEGGWWSAAASGSSSSSDGSSFKTFAELSVAMTEEELWGAVVLNCYGEGFQDLPASLCAGAAVTSQLGLWGPFALLNHSCCPNAVNYTLRDRMIVRAAAETAAGDEITINYLGRGSLRPLSQRQEELEACYAFKCNCHRCQTEFKLSGLLTAAGNTLGELLGQIQENIGTEYDTQLRQIRSQQQQQQGAEQQDQLLLLAAQMQQDWDDLLSAFHSSTASSSSDNSNKDGLKPPESKSPVSAAEQAWTKASAFDLLGLLQEALAAARQPDDEVISALVQVCETVCPGSDLHLFQALRQVSLTQQRQGLESVQARQTMTSLHYALKVRYGDQVLVDEELLRKMVAAATEAAAMVSF